MDEKISKVKSAAMMFSVRNYDKLDEAVMNEFSETSAQLDRTEKEIISKFEELGDHITDIADAVDQKTQEVREELEEEAKRSIMAEDSLQTHITQESERAKNAENTLVPRNISPALLTGANVDLNDTGVQIDISYVLPANGSNGVQSTNLPVASETNAGMIPKEAYAQIGKNASDIDALRNIGGRRIGAFDTVAELHAYVFEALDNEGDWANVREDEDHEGLGSRYFITKPGNDFVWEFDMVYHSGEVNIATQTDPGLVKGADANGKIYVESDGTMSMVGYQEIVTDVTNIKNGGEFGVYSTNTIDTNSINLNFNSRLSVQRIRIPLLSMKYKGSPLFQQIETNYERTGDGDLREVLPISAYILDERNIPIFWLDRGITAPPQSGSTALYKDEIIKPGIFLDGIEQAFSKIGCRPSTIRHAKGSIQHATPAVWEGGEKSTGYTGGATASGTYTVKYINRFEDGEVWVSNTENQRTGDQISEAYTEDTMSPLKNFATGMRYCYVMMVGAGGGGGAGGTSSGYRGYGGGGGGFAFVEVKLPEIGSVKLEIPPATNGGSTQGNGTNASYGENGMYCKITNGSNYVTCNGGSGGSGGYGGSGGSVSTSVGSVFKVLYSKAGQGYYSSTSVGGTAAHTGSFTDDTTEKNLISFSTKSGTVQSSYGYPGGASLIGNGGDGASGTNLPGFNAPDRNGNYGGGGGGAGYGTSDTSANKKGGDGARGAVYIYY